MVKRALSEHERELFERAMRDSVPLKKMPGRRKKTASKKPASAGTEGKVPARDQHQTTRRHAPGSAGIDGNTAERLRRGQLEPQARLDLHGMSERDAHRALVTFVRAARARRLRLLLVVTGKGAGGSRRKQLTETAFDLGLDMQARGILRKLTPRWLAEPGFAEFVADAREAHRRHGGAGALYVYLRKGKEA